MAKPLNFIVIGRSGCGKDTQVELIRKYFSDKLFFVSTGDLMRDVATKDTDMGKRVKKTLEEGGLVFPDLAPGLWMHQVAYNLKEDQGFIFDGLPRSLQEAEIVTRFLDYMERRDSTKVFLLDVSREEVFKRLKLRAREDDNDVAINHRLDYFDKDVQPVVDYFEKEKLLVRIDGERPVEVIFEDIKNYLK